VAAVRLSVSRVSETADMARPGLTQHRKFRRLARSLGSPVLAMGALELMWSACYDSGEEYLGTAEDIETLIGWTGDPGLVAQALVDAGKPEGHGFIEAITDGDHAGTDGVQRYRVHDLWHHAPDYVMKRHKRELERKQRVAPKVKKRRTAPNGGQRTPSPDSQIELDVTPAPAPAPAPALAQGEGAPPERRQAQNRTGVGSLLDHYSASYLARVGTRPHIQRPKDPTILADLLKQHDEPTITRAMDAMFASGDEFVVRNGYSIGIFKSQFNGFLVKARGMRPAAAGGVEVRTTMSPATAARVRQAVNQ
jgi:hypothetical protein